MRSHNPHWVADRAATVAWIATLNVEGCIEDIEAAIAAEDHSTAVECAGITVMLLGYCSLLLNGHQRLGGDEEVLAALAVHEPAWLETLCGLPPAVAADAAAAERALRTVDGAYRRIRESLPFTVPMARTPQGFYPSLRVAGQVERLRNALGLGPFEWSFDRPTGIP